MRRNYQSKINMINEKLFDEILMSPVLKGADELKIVSGYATAAMAFHHLNKIREKKKEIQLSLVVGMTPLSGMSQSNHRGFQKIMNEDYNGLFQCSYVMNVPPVHSKLYIWSKDGSPVESFIGSANYTQTAFISNNQREIITGADAGLGLAYFDAISADTISCIDPEAETSVNIFRDAKRQKQARQIPDPVHPEDAEEVDELSSLEHVSVSFINSSGEISQKSGLNWGQRPGREPNQAYIPLTAGIYKTDFFPGIGQHFTILTDDDKVLICSRAQQYGKAIQTPHNNSIIGIYFRERLAVPLGDAVVMDHFNEYGRVDIDFYKIDEETFFLDFSTPD